MLPEVLARARGILEDVTPLKTDCGLLCRGLCCRPMEGEMTGMLLFPGEERYYEGREGYRMVTAEQGTLLICSGRCDRADRPLACRLMPLIPLVREDGIKVATDQRARTVCPLARQGKDALEKHLTLIKRLKKSAEAEVSKELEDFKEYTEKYSDMPYAEYQKMKNSKKGGKK